MYIPNIIIKVISWKFIITFLWEPDAFNYRMATFLKQHNTSTGLSFIWNENRTCAGYKRESMDEKLEIQTFEWITLSIYVTKI